MTAPAGAAPELDHEYRRQGWWRDTALADTIADNAATQPTGTAFIAEGTTLDWAGYDRLSDSIGSALVAAGLDRHDTAALLLPDGPLVHGALTGTEKAGVVAMGIGHRAGDAEVSHLIKKSRARALITEPTWRDHDTAEMFKRLQAQHPELCHHLVLQGSECDPVSSQQRSRLSDRRLGPSELFMLNSTSGTTGLPKCVMQTQNRWYYFHRKAVEFGELTSADVFLGAVPTPFGFGLWTSHFTPTLLGSPTIQMRRFDVAEMLRLIEERRVSVLCAVTTQFLMMLNYPELDQHDLSSLRVMFTGGEAIPERRAAEFEERTGCAVLNFYGSNETGMLSGTKLGDPPSKRLGSCGQVIPEMAVRLYDLQHNRIDDDQGEGQPACKGPALALGYYDDAAANSELFTDDGWMFMGDVVQIDSDGYLTVVGRTAEFIIRGGKNISAAAVEDAVGQHPAVVVVAAVAAPDSVFGERVAAYVELRPESQLDLAGLREHLDAAGVSKESFPEYLFVLDELPRSSGGKIAKGDLRADARTRVQGTGLRPAG